LKLIEVQKVIQKKIESFEFLDLGEIIFENIKSLMEVVF
jgi:hypothetical protein